MLKTPLGTIEIKIDGIPTDYDYFEVPKVQSCSELDGRYAIRILFVPDGKKHKISCCIKDYTPSDRDGIEPGKRLDLNSFYKSSVKLSIGAEGDTGYLEDGTRLSEYDYDTEYLKNGVQYDILPETKTKQYVFGIAWINNVNKENDVQTWFGADPTILFR